MDVDYRCIIPRIKRLTVKRIIQNDLSVFVTNRVRTNGITPRAELFRVMCFIVETVIGRQSYTYDLS